MQVKTSLKDKKKLMMMKKTAVGYLHTVASMQSVFSHIQENLFKVYGPPVGTSNSTVNFGHAIEPEIVP
jgi:hypothetical protein